MLLILVKNDLNDIIKRSTNITYTNVHNNIICDHMVYNLVYSENILKMLICKITTNCNCISILRPITLIQ
eukprot:UN07155